MYLPQYSFNYNKLQREVKKQILYFEQKLTCQSPSPMAQLVNTGKPNMKFIEFLYPSPSGYKDIEPELPNPSTLKDCNSKVLFQINCEDIGITVAKY